MKYKSKFQPNSTKVYELVLSEHDINGLAVYYEMLEDGNFAYRLMKVSDMEEVAE